MKNIVLEIFKYYKNYMSFYLTVNMPFEGVKLVTFALKSFFSIINKKNVIYSRTSRYIHRISKIIVGLKYFLAKNCTK